MATRNKKIPIVRAADQRLYDHTGAVVCRVGSDVDESSRTGWLDWLRAIKNSSFRFEAAAGHRCTIVRELRKSGKSKNHHFYWYAHRRINKKLKREYLGVPENLTLPAMEKAAMALAQLELADAIP